MGYSAWNPISIQFAIENRDNFNFDLFSKNDLVLFSSIMFEEFKKYRKYINEHCTYTDLYNINSTKLLCPYCGKKMSEFEYNYYRCCSTCQAK